MTDQINNQSTEQTQGQTPEQTQGQTQTQAPAQTGGQTADAQQNAPRQEQTQEQNKEQTNAEQGEKGLLDDVLDEPKPEQPQVPDKYEFKTAEGAEPLSDEDAAAYSAVAKEMGLTQEQAQKLFDSASPKIAQIYERKAKAVMAQAQRNWNSALQADEELGGENLQTTKLNIQKFMRGFGTPGFTSLMKATGMLNHPELARVMARVGAAMGSDNVFINGQTKPTPKKDPLKDLYNNSPDLV